MYKSVSILLFFFPFAASAQFYYNDIASTQEICARMKTFLLENVKSVITTGYDERGMKTTDFNEWQEVQQDKRILKVTTRNGQSVGRIYYSFDADSNLVQVRDSSRGIQSVTSYSYDVNKNITLVKMNVTDSLKDFSETEVRQWIYKNGKVDRMWRIINGKDSTLYQFKLDETGNVGEESLIRRTVPVDVVYYYYNDNKSISDIVRYNKKAKRLLPDVMFEYDDNRNIIQKTTTLSTSSIPNYLIWRYAFNNKGLKTKEALFNKQKELMGRLEYAYTFSK